MTQPLVQSVNQADEELILCGETFLTHPSGALFWPATQTLIVADLYIRSGYSFSALKQVGYKSQASEHINVIKDLIIINDIKTVIALGRSFRRLDDPYHLEGSDVTALYNIQKQVDWLWVAGPMARHYPSLVGGIRMTKYEQKGFNFRAMPRKEPVSHEIAAGMYPMARLKTEEQSIIKEPGLPAYVSNRKRLLMPAFGRKLAACNILGDEFISIFGYDELMVQVADTFRTYAVARSTLKAE